MRVEEKFQQAIAGEGLWGGWLRIFDELPSTNGWAMDHLDICLHGDVIWAHRQTEGRGRMGRTWISPGSQGLTLSIVLADWTQELMPVVGQITALAVWRMLKHYGIKAQLKWPNDVLTGGKKIAGILAEGDLKRGIIVVGIGLNVNLGQQDIAQGSFDKPTTSMKIEKGIDFDLYVVGKRLMAEAENAFDEAKKAGMPILLENWKQNDWLSGKKICISVPNRTIRGVYRGLDGRGRLCLMDEDGKGHVFWAGDVERIE